MPRTALIVISSGVACFFFNDNNNTPKVVGWVVGWFAAVKVVKSQKKISKCIFLDFEIVGGNISPI